MDIGESSVYDIYLPLYNQRLRLAAHRVGRIHEAG